MSYIQFLCREGYTGSSIAVLAGTKTINCSTLIPGQGHDALNYPTFQLSLKSTQRPTTTTFRRRVTNVAHPVSVYNATIKAPPGVEITVTPTTLSFSRLLQKKSFKVVVKASPLPSGKMVSGSLAWIGARHVVRSPIVVYSPWRWWIVGEDLLKCAFCRCIIVVIKLLCVGLILCDGMICLRRQH